MQNKRAEAAFQQILSGPAATVSVPEANEVVVRRKQLLSNYTRPGIPPDLREKFATAMKLTDASHEEGQGLATLAEQISAVADTPATEQLYRSGHTLDAIIRQLSTEMELTDTSHEQGQGLATLAERVSALADMPAAEQLSAGTDSSERDLRMMRMMSSIERASRMVRMVRAIALRAEVLECETTLDNLAIIARFGLIWRGLLYTGIIGTLGSKLERQASLEKFKKDLGETPSEVLSMVVPVVGEYIGKAKLLFNMWDDLMNKGQALAADAADLVAKQTRASEFVELYVASLQTWPTRRER